jgi:hypothetical protein
MRTAAWAANESNQLLCSDCAVRPFSFCARLDRAELHELDHLGRRVHFLPRETAFAQEELTTSFFNLLEGVMRLYKLLPDGRRHSWDWQSPYITPSLPTRSGQLPYVAFPEFPSRCLSKINRTSCTA